MIINLYMVSFELISKDSVSSTRTTLVPPRLELLQSHMVVKMTCKQPLPQLVPSLSQLMQVQMLFV